MQLDSETQDMQHSIHNLITLRSSRAELLKHKIMALSPLAVLDRGYSIVTDSEGRTLKSISQTRSGDVISVKMSDGSVSAKVQEVSDGR